MGLKGAENRMRIFFYSVKSRRIWGQRIPKTQLLESQTVKRLLSGKEPYEKAVRVVRKNDYSDTYRNDDVGSFGIRS